MWLFTKLGFFSVVRKKAGKTLTVRARVRGELERLREEALPELGPTEEDGGSDYRFRATVPAAAFGRAVGELAAGIDYSNFKSEVARVQGDDRAAPYHDVWDVMFALQEKQRKQEASTPKKPKKPKPVAAPVTRVAAPITDPETKKKRAYGGFVVRDGALLLRSPAGGIDGERWTLPKGKPAMGETEEETALREVHEETGIRAKVLERIPGSFPTGNSSSVYFVMEVVGDDGFKPNKETREIRWVPLEEAKAFLTKEAGAKKERELAVLAAALALGVQRVRGKR